jgi:thiamine biosynthesis lipoprotein
MASPFRITILHDDARQAERAALAAFAEADRLERELSRFLPGSDIAHIASLAPGRRLVLSPDPWACLCLAMRLSRATGGAFDPLFRSARGRGKPVLRFHNSSRSVSVTGPGVVVDLGAVGKGYAVDRVAGLLGEFDAVPALVSAGDSTVVAVGSPPGSAGWTVALRAPGRGERMTASVTLKDRALSGSAARLRAGHIRAPRSGLPARATGASWVSCAGPCAGALSDALSTAFFVGGPSLARRYCARHAGVLGIITGVKQASCRTFGSPRGIVHPFRNSQWRRSP